MNFSDAKKVFKGEINIQALRVNLRLVLKEKEDLIKENHDLRQQVANMEWMFDLIAYQDEDPIDETWEGPEDDYMKLLVCPHCKDVKLLVKVEWRQCHCKQSGGQYCDDGVTAVVGGEGAIMGISNDMLDLDFMKPPREIIATRKKRHFQTDIWWGEYRGDRQILRIYKNDGPIPDDWRERLADLKAKGGSPGRIKEAETA